MHLFVRFPKSSTPTKYFETSLCFKKSYFQNFFYYEVIVQQTVLTYIPVMNDAIINHTIKSCIPIQHTDAIHVIHLCPP